jgi:hypothetical protein
MKPVILFVIGLFVGTMCATVVVNTLRERDAYARGVMDVMQHHYASLRQEIRAQHCDATKSAQAITQLRAMASEVEPAIYPDSIPDAPFREFNQRLHDDVEKIPTPPPADCAALAPLVQKIGRACDACHQQYR